MFRSMLALAAILTLVGNPAVAQSGTAELEAQLKELKASRATAPPEMQKVLDQQIEATQQTIELSRATEGKKAPTVALKEEMRPFFTPAPAASVPAWIDDGAKKADVTDAMMKCPKGAKVYRTGDAISCAIPAGKKGGIPAQNGLALDFHASTGGLRSQAVYEKGLLRWSIEYHATGKRSLVATFDDVERLVHRENGLRTAYAANGTVTSQAEYASGVRQGWTKLWEDDGRPISATRYEKGTAVEEVLPDGTKRPLAAK